MQTTTLIERALNAIHQEAEELNRLIREFAELEPSASQESELPVEIRNADKT